MFLFNQSIPKIPIIYFYSWDSALPPSCPDMQLLESDSSCSQEGNVQTRHKRSPAQAQPQRELKTLVPRALSGHGTHATHTLDTYFTL